MRVLVACERRGTVRDAFLTEGHDAISCDLLPTESPGPHIQGDVRLFLREDWDLVIAHPPCTYLTRARGRLRDIPKLIEAAEFFMECLNANAPRVAVENPTPYKYVRQLIGEPNCIVQPFHFGDWYTKRTCFWLRGLPPLMAEISWAETEPWCPANSGKKRGKGKPSEYDKTFPGIARAMARQWGSF